MSEFHPWAMLVIAAVAGTALGGIAGEVTWRLHRRRLLSKWRGE